MGSTINSFNLPERAAMQIAAVESSLRAFAEFPVLQREITALQLRGTVHLLAIGKSAVPMARIATKCLSSMGLSWDGYCLGKYGYLDNAPEHLIPLEAAHPLPDANSVKHSAAILDWLRQLPFQDILIVLLSGGGSALLEVPEDSYTLDSIISLNRELLKSGLSIAAMNEQRRAYSKVKGGKALKHVTCGRICVFALSDVAGNDPRTIASGPFTPALEPDNRMSYHIIGDNYSLRQLLATSLNAPVINQKDYLDCSASEAAMYLEQFCSHKGQKGTYLFGGETPESVSGNGQGGRCTHLALDFARRIAGKSGISLLCYASDGCDNVEGVAGAFVTGESIRELENKGIDPEMHLRNCDSLTALSSIGAIIPSYSVRINVNDIFILHITD